MNNAFYSAHELQSLGFRAVGTDVYISRKASIYRPDAITIGNRVRIDDFCVLSGGRGIELGSFIHIGAHAALYGGSGIVMGDFSTLSGRVSVYSESDDYSGASLTNPMVPDEYKPGYQRGAVTIGRHCIVGAASTILPGVTLGDGVAVGAHSLVNKDCAPWTVVVGAPARFLRERSHALLELEKELIAKWQIHVSP